MSKNVHDSVCKGGTKGVEMAALVRLQKLTIGQEKQQWDPLG